MMSFLGRLVSTVKTAYDFVQSRYPSSDPFAPVPVSQQELETTSVYSLVEYLGDVGVYQEVSNKVFHVFVFVQPLSKHYSIVRTGDAKEALSFGLLLSKHTVLLSFINSERLLQLLTIELNSHPSWKSTHIASRIGLWAFFEILEGTGDSDSIANELAVPDGLSCLHIAAGSDIYCKRGKAATAAAVIDSAAQEANKCVIRHLLTMGAGAGQPDSNKSNAFHHAALGDNAGAVELLVQSLSQPDCVDAVNDAGFTPLYLAAENQNYSTFKALVSHGASPAVACLGQTPVERLIMNYTPEGHTEFAICIDLIVNQCPRALLHRDPSSGATVLHKIKQKPVLKCLLTSCASSSHSQLLDVNVRDNDGQTPLHHAVSGGRLDIVVELVAGGADVNMEDLRGWTPLHIAISNSNFLLVKALLVFGASPHFVSDDIPSTLHFAALMSTGPHRDAICNALNTCGFPICKEKMPDCTHFCSDSKQETVSQSDDVDMFNLEQCVDAVIRDRQSNSTRKTKQNLPKIVNLLSLDGGGIRGLVLIQVLLWLESRHHSKEPFLSRFNWICGTSTGAILAIGLATGRSLRECQRLYFRFKDVVFTGKRPYDTAVLERFLKQEFGSTTSMHDIIEPRVMVTSVMGDQVPVELVFFRNYVLPSCTSSQMSSLYQRYHYCDPKTSSLWKAARCSSAAPSYFAPVDDKFVDGGLVANNPAMDLVADVQRHNNVLKFNRSHEDCVRIGSLLSIGTGHMPATAVANQFDFSLPANYLDVVMKGFALKDMAKLLIEQVTIADGAPVDRMQAWCGMADIPYFRFSPQLSSDVPLDATDDVTLVSMLWDTMDYMGRPDMRAETEMAMKILNCDS